MKIKIMLLFVLMVIPLAFAVEEIKQCQKDAPCLLTRNCFNLQRNYTLCSASTECNISITNDDDSIIIDNAEMTSQGSKFSYYFNETHKNGIYTATIRCYDLGLSGYAQFPIRVSPEGTATGIRSLDLNSITGLFTIFILIILWIGLQGLGFFFGNYYFLTFGFFIGVILAMSLFAMSFLLSISFLIVSIIMYIAIAKSIKT